MANSGFYRWKDVEYYDDEVLYTIPADFRITWAAVQSQQILLTIYMYEQPVDYFILSTGAIQEIDYVSPNPDEEWAVKGQLTCSSGPPSSSVDYSLKFTAVEEAYGEDGILVDWGNDATTKTGR